MGGIILDIFMMIETTLLFCPPDEEYARKLQAEQDHNDSQALQSPSKRPGPPVSSPLKKPPVKPLAEIMEEELSKQKTREELVIFEPPRGKTNNVVSEQVRHKPACTSTVKS